MFNKMSKRNWFHKWKTGGKKRRIGKGLYTVLMSMILVLQTLTLSFPNSGNVMAKTALQEEEGGIGWKIANAALSYLGYGYEMNNKRDGSEESGYTFDCSGLIWVALRDAGITGLTSSYPTLEVWSTSDWNNAITSHSLGIAKNGKTLNVRYADSLASYRAILAERDPDSVVIYTGTDADTSSLRTSDFLTTGDLVITRNDPNGNHAQIVLGTYPYSGSGHEGVMAYFADTMSSLANAFPNTINRRLSSAVPVLVDDNPEVYQKTGILTSMKPLAKYSSTYAGRQLYSSGIQSSWLCMLNLETIGGSVSPASNPVWVVDDASKDSGVRLTNRLMGKSATSFAYLIHFPEARQCSAELRVRKMSEQTDGSFSATNDAEFTMYTDAACTKDARVLSHKNSDPTGVFSFEWKDKREWSNYFHLTDEETVQEPRTVYLKETKAPAGHVTNSSVFRAVITPAKDQNRMSESSAVFYAGNNGTNSNTQLGPSLNQTYQAYADPTLAALVVRNSFLRASGSMSCGIDKELANGSGQITAQFQVTSRSGGFATAREAVASAAADWQNAAIVNTPYRYSKGHGDGGATVTGLIPGTRYYAKIMKEYGVGNLASGAELTMDSSFYVAIMKLTVSNDGTVTSETTYGKAGSLSDLTGGNWQEVSSGITTENGSDRILKISNEIRSEQVHFSTQIFKYGKDEQEPLRASFATGEYSESIAEAVRSFANSSTVISSAENGYTDRQVSNSFRIPAGETKTMYKIYREQEVLTQKENTTYRINPKYYLAEVSSEADLYGKAGGQRTVWYVNDSLSESGWRRLSDTEGTASSSDQLLKVQNRPFYHQSFTFSGKKVFLTENDRELQPGEFTFRLTQTASPSAQYEGYFADQEAKTEEGGTFTFPESFTFLFDPANGIDMRGLWKFEITEIKPVDENAEQKEQEQSGEQNQQTRQGDGEILYSEEVYELSVLVTVPENGGMTIQEQLTRKTGDEETEAEDILFTNYYAAKGKVDYKLFKEFEKTLSGGEFLFDFICEDSTAGPNHDGSDALRPGSTREELLALMSREMILNNAAGEVFIPVLEFEKNTEKKTDMTGLYYFTIREHKGDAFFVSYDTSEYHFVLEVTDDTNGNLKTVLSDENGNPVEEQEFLVHFRNGYCSSGTLSFRGQKELEVQMRNEATNGMKASMGSGTGKGTEDTAGFDSVKRLDELKAGQFTFDLVNTLWPEGGSRIPSQSTVNREDGSFEFDEILFTADSTDRFSLGTYRFEITERAGDDTDLLYSKQKYVYEVEVLDEVEEYDSKSAGTLTIRKKLIALTDPDGNEADLNSVRNPNPEEEITEAAEGKETPESERKEILFLNRRIITPTPIPSDTPTPVPSDTPTPVPSDTPSPIPSEGPTIVPSEAPPLSETITPSAPLTPFVSVTPGPSVTPAPSVTPTIVPTPGTTMTVTPTPVPSKTPVLGVTAFGKMIACALFGMGGLLFIIFLLMIRRFS